MKKAAVWLLPRIAPCVLFASCSKSEGSSSNMGRGNTQNLAASINVEKNSVNPVNSYLERLGINLSDYFLPSSIDAVTFDGKTCAIPLGTHSKVIYFNLFGANVA